MLVEIETPLLSRMTDEDLGAIKALIMKSSSCIWVTAGGFLSGKSPERSLVSGLAKSLMTEQPTFQLSTFDIDPDQESFTRSADLIVQHELDLRDQSADLGDTDLIEKDGIVYISRYVVDEEGNHQFEKRNRPSPVSSLLKPGLDLNFLRVGQIESYYFKQKPTEELALFAGQVLVECRSFSLTKTVRISPQGS